MANEHVEIKIVDSPPMAPMPTPTHRMKRIPSLNHVSAWSPDEEHQSPLLHEEKHNYTTEYALVDRIIIGYRKH